MEIGGTCKPGFEAVQDAFEANFAEGLEVGAAAAVTLDGEFVVDIWGGEADADGTPWQRDTIVNVYSTTKTMAATCMLMLADRGELDFDAPVARYWPEFAQNGKEGVLVSHVMAHTAGVPGFDPPLANVEQLYDLEAVADNLAAQAPWWEPGTASGYHAISQGNLQSEILYRITGRRMADWFRTEVAEPLGADFWMSRARFGGSPGRRAGAARCSAATSSRSTGRRCRPTRSRCRAILSVADDRQPSRPPGSGGPRRSPQPAGSGTHGRNRPHPLGAGLRRNAVNGVRLMSEAGARRALEEQTDRIDQVLMVRMRHGLGFGLQLGEMFTTEPGQMFWGGWGGSLSAVDLYNRLSVAYVMNRMDADLMGDVRGRRIVDAVKTCL